MNKSSKKWKSLLLTVLLVINMAALTSFVINKFSEPEPTTSITGEHPMVDFLEQELDFTPQQLESFRDSKSRFEQSTIRLRNQLKNLRQEMFNELSNKNSDQEKLSDLAEKFGEAEGEFKKLTMNHFLEMKAICNPEQKKVLTRYFEMIENRPGMGRGPGHGRGRGMGPNHPRNN